MTAAYDRAVGIDRLKDHYKHCIRLSASNKINPKNAFDLQLIDYMQDLVSSTEDGQMNFKIASSALDVGAKIYSNRVDRIQSEAQKVASSILMALDGQNTGKHQTNDDDTLDDPNVSGGSNRMNESHESDEATGQEREKDKKKISRKKNVKTVVEDETSLNAKLEKIILGDAFLDGLSREFDMSCPAALICYNALTQPNCLLTIESNNLRKNYMEHEPKKPATSPSPDLDLAPIVEEETDNDGDVMMEEEIPTSIQDLNSNSQYDFVTLISKKVNCAQIIRNNQNNRICPRLETFLFNDRSTSLSGTQPSDDYGAQNSSQGQAYVNKTSVGGIHEFNPEHYGANQDSDGGDDHFGGDADSVMGDNSNDANENVHPIPNLDKIAASKPTEYGYANEHHRLLNTWAGPHAWKVLKVPPTGKKDAPKSTRKRSKLEPVPIDFTEDHDPSGEKIADKDVRFSADVIKRWKKPLLPQDHNLNDEKIRKVVIKAFLRPEDTYHCKNTPSEALLLVSNDHNYFKNKQDDGDSDGGFASPAMGGFDDVHDDSDMEFRADPVVDGQEVAIYGAPINNTLAQQADLEFAGENLIEQPFEVAQVNIPFAKIAKKMDVRRLKRVMWDLLFPPEKRDLLETTAVENGTGLKGRAADITKAADNDGNQSACMEVGGDRNETVVMNSTPLKKTTSPTPSESAVHLEFSNLYGELPVRVSNKMANDLSQPIAFVTLLHLANEKNLKLIPNLDLKDFIIEQDEMIHL